ncbi:MAG: hypothetical protein ACYDDV_10350 [Methanoregula sp.]
MKHSFLVILALLIAGVMVAGCTQSPAAPGVTPVPTYSAISVATTPAPQPSFSLGDHYLNDPGGYQLLTEKDTVVKEFRVDTRSWGIYFKIQPLNDNLQYCWFVMDVTDVNRNSTESFGYGRDHSFESEQWIPMYNDGPYKLTMKGNNVKVWVTAAKRNP